MGAGGAAGPLLRVVRDVAVGPSLPPVRGMRPGATRRRLPSVLVLMKPGRKAQGVAQMQTVTGFCTEQRTEPAPRRRVELWPHQAAGLAAAHEAARAGRPSGLIVLPTGSGKTVLFLTLARELGWPTLVLVHRDELISQTLETVVRVWPEARAGVVQGKRDEWRDGQEVVVASVQSLHSRRLAKMPRDRFGLIVVDEAHHTPAGTYAGVFDHFAGRRFLLGVTATPERLDGVGLCRWYGEEPIFSYSIRQAVGDGILVPPVQRQVFTHVNLDSVRKRGGDLAEGELARAVNTPARNKAVVEAFIEHARGRKTVAFCVDVQHAQDLAEAFGAAGVRATSITGDLPTLERRILLEGFSEGEFRVATTCLVLTEGFDEPSVDAVVMARPTASHALYIQCVGRGRRRCDATGKRDCLVLDVTDNCRRHKLVTAASLLDSPREGADEQPPEGGDGSGGAAPPAAEPDLVWTLLEVSPWPEAPSLKSYHPTRSWQFLPASDKQLHLLRPFGLQLNRQLTRGEASHLIDQAIAFEEEFPTPASPGQQ
jgi:superfamily II DNA or RNA helicase